MNRHSSPRRPRPHWSECSLWNPRRWRALPLLVGGLGAALAWTGAVVQALAGGFSLWGIACLVGLIVVVGSMAWAQAEIENLKRKNARQHERNRTGRV